MAEEESREEVEEIINNEEPIKEAVIETIIEEEEVKPTPKPKPKATNMAKPKIKITKGPVEEAMHKNEEEPIIEEQPTPVKVDKLKQIVKCPDCNMDMTQHTLKYIHKKTRFLYSNKSRTRKNTRTSTRTTKAKHYRRSCK